MSQPPLTLYSFLAGQTFTAREDALARARGTTAENVRQVAMNKILDAQAAVKEMIAITEEGETQSQLRELYNGLV